MTRALVVAAALLAGASPAAGAPAEAAAAPGAPGRAAPASAQHALAVELASFALPEDRWQQMIRGVGEQTRQYVEASIRQNGGQVPAEFAPAFDEAFRALLTRQELLDLQAGLLVKYYTEDELRELLAFYKTPLGQKSLRIMPEVAQDVNGQMMGILQQRLPAMMERLTATLKGQPPAAAPAAAPKPKKAPGKQAN